MSIEIKFVETKANYQRDIILAIENGFHCLIIGETGVGKTTLIKHVAETHFKKQVKRINLNGEFGITELIGKWLIKDGQTYWQDGVLTQCLRSGTWVVLDEINAALPEILMCLNSLMDDGRGLTLSEKDGEFVPAHKNFRLFATMNPPDDYVGTKELNKALLSRFQIVINMDKPKPDEEVNILMQNSGLGETDSKVIVDVCNSIRSLKFDDKKISYTCSLRDSLNWAKIYAANNHTIQDSMEIAILNKAHPEDLTQIKTVLKENKLFSQFFEKKFKAGRLDIFLSVDIGERVKKANDSVRKLKDRYRTINKEINKASDMLKQLNSNIEDSALEEIE